VSAAASLMGLMQTLLTRSFVPSVGSSGSGSESVWKSRRITCTSTAPLTHMMDSKVSAVCGTGMLFAQSALRGRPAAQTGVEI